MQPASSASKSFVHRQLMRVGLSDALARETAACVKVQDFEAGKRLWVKGGDIRQWMLIVNGLVCASVPTTNSASTPISVYGRGAWFGEQSIINRKPSYADYVAMTPTEVLMMPAPQFDRLFLAEPNFARFVAKLMAWRVQKTTETLTLMKLGTPCMRVVMGLAQFAEALAYRSDRPPTIGFGEGVELPVAQNTLASLCGVSRTLFSEFVQQLAAHGWLALSYGKLEILSIHTWHAFARSQREDSTHAVTADIQELLGMLDRLRAQDSADRL